MLTALHHFWSTFIPSYSSPPTDRCNKQCNFYVPHSTDKTHGKVRCYECFVAPRRTENRTSYEKLCTKFDESKPFERECPYSTMCIKKTYRLELLNGDVQETIERGCAMQKYDYMVGIFNDRYLRKCLLIAIFPVRTMWITSGWRRCLWRSHTRKAVWKRMDMKSVIAAEIFAIRACG